MMMCFCLFLFGSHFFGTLGFLDFLEVCFLCQIGEVFLHYFFKQVFNDLLFLFSSGTPMIHMLEHLKLSQRFLGLSSFFLSSCFFILFQLNVYFSLLVQIIYMNPGFLPFTVGSLYILLYFTLGSLHFSAKLNQFCQHPDYQYFELCIL